MSEPVAVGVEPPYSASVSTTESVTRAMFTLAEWLTILAAIRFAGLKTQSLPLYSISMLLQWALFFYLVAQRSHWARRYVRPLRDRKWLFWSVGVLVSAGITVAANWLVEDTVSRLVQAAAGP